jgi:hypothetical protein
MRKGDANTTIRRCQTKLPKSDLDTKSHLDPHFAQLVIVTKKLSDGEKQRRPGFAGITGVGSQRAFPLTRRREFATLAIALS